MFKLLKKCMLITAIVFVAVVFTAVLRTLYVKDPDPVAECNSSEDDYYIPNKNAIKRFSKALTFQTVTTEPYNYNKKELELFSRFLIESFPVVHSSPLISREVVNNYSLLYRVKGSDSLLKPFLLAGHMDVVPVVEKEWKIAPFSGYIENGHIYGRGSVDAKHIVMGILEALEFLLKKSFLPQRSFFLAFGHDEEGGGYDGAYHIGRVLSSEGVDLEYILDEGTFVINNSAPGVQVPAAMIGVSEKGSLNLQLTVSATPGHSSFPPKETAIVILSKALAKLEGDVLPSMLGQGSEEAFFQSLAPYASFLNKLVYSNVWLFKPAIEWKMGKNKIMNSLIRTTTAVTMVSGGLKDNVIPSSASANVNFRVHPAQTIEEVVEYVQHIINDKRVQLKVKSSFPAHPVSPYSDTNFGYTTIKQSIRQIFPDCCVVPITMIANTDTRWYLNLTQSIYRFSPVNMKPEDTSCVHGHNERISVKNYFQLINFYIHLLKNSDKKSLEINKNIKNEL